jgi:uncharacterized protein (DUF488 family)
MPRASKSASELPRNVLYTIGHSTHPIETFLELLAQHQIVLLADVRSFPSSRRWPQFNQNALKASLETRQIAYEWIGGLGGRRHSKLAASLHSAWEHPAFRSYAEYADTPLFAAGLGQLLESAEKRRTAIMCSEGLWWRCHRRIISDHVIIRRWEVRHIMPDGKLAVHSLTQIARIDDSRIVYDGGRLK